MKRFLVFMYELKANGGVEDFVEAGDTVEELENIIRTAFSEDLDLDLPEDIEDLYVSILDIKTGEQIMNKNSTGYLISNANNISIIDEKTLSIILNRIDNILLK